MGVVVGPMGTGDPLASLAWQRVFSFSMIGTWAALSNCGEAV